MNQTVEPTYIMTQGIQFRPTIIGKSFFLITLVSISSFFSSCNSKSTSQDAAVPANAAVPVNAEEISSEITSFEKEIGEVIVHFEQGEVSRFPEKTHKTWLHLTNLKKVMSKAQINGMAKITLNLATTSRKYAESGNASAQYILGRCYARGEGVAKDPVQAVQWFCKAAGQDDTRAQNALGDCYMTGEGVSKDPAKAVQWYRMAADQGDEWVQVDLAFCYATGEGVGEKDLVQAAQWFRKAADQGNSYAQSTLGAYYATGEGVNKDPV
ncbi:MAG: tetratricopeptide repeat protein [Planctomycetota bacterium]